MIHVKADELAVGERGILINYSTGLHSRWIRTDRWLVFWRKAIYECHLDAQFPLLWWDEADQLFYMPDRHINKTDFGSIPPPFRGWFPHDEFPPCYYFHDRGYDEGGLYAAPTLEVPFQFKRLSRSWLDDRCLSAMPQALGTIQCRTGVIWGAVRVCGSSNYKG